jgi:hypothetical protein
MHAWSHCFLSQPALRFLCTSALVLTSLFTAVPAFAGTHWNYSVVGFSPDGRYAALEQSGMVDGIGLPDCYVELYDLDANTKNDVHPAAPAGTPPIMQTCDEAHEYARDVLGNYGIDSKHKGSTLTLDPQSGEQDPNGTAPKITAMDFTFKKKTCRMKLYKKSDQGDNPWGRTMINWNVGISCGNEKERLVLPQERSNFSVSIKEARIVGDRLVLFPATTYQDFEEPGSSTGVIGIVIDQALPVGVKLDIEVLGFSDDEKYFGYWLSGADARAKKSRAEFHLLSTNGGEKVLKESETGPADSDPKAVLAKLKERMKGKLGELKLGNDPGAEMYKSGTATKTAFKVAGSGEHQLLLKVDKTSGGIDEPTELVLRRPDKTEINLFQSPVGFRYSLNTVRLSKSKESLAVVLKYSLIEQAFEDRAYAVSFAPIKK